MGPERYVDHIRHDRPTIAQVFEDYIPAGGAYGSPRPIDLGEVVVKGTGFRRANSSLDLIPSRLELSRTLKNPTGKERRLAKALARISDRYDLVLIDCAPTESILTDAAYFASRYVIVPVKPEFMATIGLPLLARSLQEFRIENDDHTIEIAGLVFNHSSSYSGGPEGRKSITEVEDVARVHDWHIFQSRIRYSGSYPKAARAGLLWRRRATFTGTFVKNSKTSRTSSSAGSASGGGLHESGQGSSRAGTPTADRTTRKGKGERSAFLNRKHRPCCTGFRRQDL